MNIVNFENFCGIVLTAILTGDYIFIIKVQRRAKFLIFTLHFIQNIIMKFGIILFFFQRVRIIKSLFLTVLLYSIHPPVLRQQSGFSSMAPFQR